MIDLKKTIEQRIQKIIVITEATTKKIIKKEMNKLKRDIIRQLKDGHN